MPYAVEKRGPTRALAAYAEAVAGATHRALGRRLPWPYPPVRLDFTSNDYLGFARDPRLAAAAARAARRFGTGATGSRLLSGDGALVRALERRIARTLGAEAALVFPSGWQLNAGVGAALLDRGVLGSEPLVYCDRGMHASAYAAFAAAGVHPKRYAHGDLTHLADLLEADRASDAPRFIFTESIFGMDGDATDVEALVQLAERYDAMIYLDDAHAVGVAGAGGYGLASHAAQHGAIVMGTFSKALGGAGAYVACEARVRDYLVQRCGGFIYTTAMPPTVAAAALCAWRELGSADAVRERLGRLAHDLRTRLQALGFATGTSTTHIVPVLVGDAARALALRDALLGEGIAVSAVRPPTVPPRGSRLRIALNARHDDGDVDEFIAALRRCA